jgi:hypothetical protein
MIHLKKELFKKEYGYDFPFYNELDSFDCVQIRSDIIAKYKFKESCLEKNISTNASFFDKMNAEDNDFNFINLLCFLGLESTNSLFLTWDSFLNIDKFKLLDLDKYFEDIWFPCSDDIDIVSDDLAWIISIRHDGAVYFHTPN